MLQSVERGFFKSVIQLSDSTGGNAGFEKVSPKVQVLRVGKFNHPEYGQFEITKKTLAEMKANFDARVRGVDIAFDYFHDSDKEAAGWLKDLELHEDGSELWAVVDWTPKAGKMLSEREVRYFSPDFAFKWQDAETGKTYTNVLFGGGLTNRPFVKEMAAIVAAENKGGRMNELEQLKEQVKKLAEEKEALTKKLAEAGNSDDNDGDEDRDANGGMGDKVKALEEKLSELQGKHDELQKAHKDLIKTHNEMLDQKKLTEKEAEFTVLLTEGKACAAQKEAFIKGDMASFIKLAQPVNLSNRGHNDNPSEGNASDYDDRVLALAEEKMKADKKLDKVAAITLANKELKK